MWRDWIDSFKNNFWKSLLTLLVGLVGIFIIVLVSTMCYYDELKEGYTFWEMVLTGYFASLVVLFAASVFADLLFWILDKIWGL